jgi:hypothetical protein
VVANMLVEDHLHPAAVKAGVLSSHCDIRGHLVDDDPRRFGFTIFATASRRFSSAPEPIPKPCKHSFAIVKSSCRCSSPPTRSVGIAWLLQEKCSQRFSAARQSRAD